MKTSSILERPNRRHQRAAALLAAVYQAIAPYLDAREDPGEVRGLIMDLLTAEGVEVLTDRMRADIGLSPRGPDGWTAEEILALEAHRLDAMLRPLPLLPIGGLP